MKSSLETDAKLADIIRYCSVVDTQFNVQNSETISDCKLRKCNTFYYFRLLQITISKDLTQGNE